MLIDVQESAKLVWTKRLFWNGFNVHPSPPAQIFYDSSVRLNDHNVIGWFWKARFYVWNRIFPFFSWARSSFPVTIFAVHTTVVTVRHYGTPKHYCALYNVHVRRTVYCTFPNNFFKLLPFSQLSPQSYSNVIITYTLINFN